MYRLAVLCCAVLSGLCWARPQDEKYTTKYDSVDIEQILQNERLFLRYVACLLKDESCTPDVNAVKEVLADALATECARCSELQKQKADRVFVYTYNNKRDVFDQLVAKYDPKGEHREHYAKYAEERGIKF